MQHPLSMIDGLARQSVPGPCPACEGSRSRVFFELGPVPVNCISLCPTPQEAERCPRGSIQLAFCADCGAIYNQAFNSQLLDYDRRYDNSLHFSPSFQRYAEELAERLIARYDLHNKDVIEVGCGKGEFLALLCSRGANRGLGFDPAYEPGRVDTRVGEGFRVIPDYYSERYTEYPADFLCCRHVLEHIITPRSFLGDIRHALRNRTTCAVFFEVPSAGAVFEGMGIWDIIYEHCFYYNPGSLERLFTECGFKVFATYDSFQGQYLCLEARAAIGAGAAECSRANSWERASFGTLERFGDDYCRRKQYWHEQLETLASAGKRVVVWGSGAKGATFLNALREVSRIEYVVDMNPYKQGMFVPGTGQEVVAPQFLQRYAPDLVLITNRNYESEIRREVTELGLRPDFQLV